MNTGTLISYGTKISRDELALIPTPDATRTHQPIPHHKIVHSLIETLSFRHIGVLKDEYAVSGNGMKMFGVLDLETGFEGCRFSIGIRNSHDKSFRLAVTAGLRVTVCENMMFNGDFTPVLAKHSKNFSLQDCLCIGVDRMQRNFEPMKRQVEQWQESQIPDVTAKLIIYRAFVDGELEAPSSLMVDSASELLPARAPRVLKSNPLEPMQRLHQRVQRTGSHSPIQGHRQTRRVSVEGTVMNLFHNSLHNSVAP